MELVFYLKLQFQIVYVVLIVSVSMMTVYTPNACESKKAFNNVQSE